MSGWQGSIILAFSYRNSPPDPLWLILIGGAALTAFSAYAIREEWDLTKLRWRNLIFACLMFVFGVGFLIDGFVQMLRH